MADSESTAVHSLFSNRFPDSQPSPQSIPGGRPFVQTTAKPNPSVAQSFAPPGRNGATRSTQLSQEKDRLHPVEPLIFTDPGSFVYDDPGLEAALLESANQLLIEIAAPGYPPGSPEYLDHWNLMADQSNQLLRQRYGGQVWMAHHIESHHLRTANGEGN